MKAKVISKLRCTSTSPILLVTLGTLILSNGACCQQSSASATSSISSSSSIISTSTLNEFRYQTSSRRSSSRRTSSSSSSDPTDQSSPPPEASAVGLGRDEEQHARLCQSRFVKFHANHTACLGPNQQCKLRRVSGRGVALKRKLLTMFVHFFAAKRCDQSGCTNHTGRSQPISKSIGQRK